MLTLHELNPQHARWIWTYWAGVRGAPLTIPQHLFLVPRTTPPPLGRTNRRYFQAVYRVRDNVTINDRPLCGTNLRTRSTAPRAHASFPWLEVPLCLECVVREPAVNGAFQDNANNTDPWNVRRMAHPDAWREPDPVTGQ